MPFSYGTVTAHRPLSGRRENENDTPPTAVPIIPFCTRGHGHSIMGEADQIGGSWLPHATAFGNCE